jgi:hypothetical protein
MNSVKDLRNYVDGIDFDTVSDWGSVVDRVVSKINNHPDCPEWGEDWSGFLAGLDIEALIIEADDELINAAIDRAISGGGK